MSSRPRGPSRGPGRRRSARARESLKVEERVLELARQELTRTRALYDGDNAPQIDAVLDDLGLVPAEAREGKSAVLSGDH